MAKEFVMGARLQLNDMFSRPLKDMQRATDQFRASVHRADGGLTTVNRTTSNSIGTFARFAAGAKAAGDGLAVIGNRGRTVIDTLKEITVAQAAAAAGAVGLGLGIKTGIGTAMDFEAQLSSIKAVTGLASEEMTQLRNLAMEMGAKTKYSALEAAQGMEEMLKAGLKPAQIQAGALEAGLSLATAGELQLADAAEIMSTALNAFKKDGMAAQDAANILAGAANSSATTVGELRYGLSQVSAVAAGAGMNFKDTAAALGIFANAGLKGSDGGTSLKTMLANLQPTTKQSIQLFKDLGLMTADGANKFYDSEGRLKSLREISGLLQSSLSRLTDQQRSFALMQIFGSDAVRAGNILFEAGAKAVDEFYASMDKVTALDVAKEKMNNAKGAVELLKGAWETLQIAVFTPMLPMLRKIALGFADVVESMNHFVAGEQFTAFLRRIKGIYSGTIGYMEYKFKQLYNNNKETIGRLKAIFTDLFGEFGQASQSALYWIQYIGIPKLIQGMVAVGQGVLDVAKFFMENWEPIKSTVASIIDSVIEFKNTALETFTAFTDTLVENQNSIYAVSTILTVYLLPALIRVSAQAALTGTSLVGAMIMARVEAVKTAAVMTGQMVMSMLRYTAVSWAVVAAQATTAAGWVASRVVILTSAAATGIATAAQWALNTAMYAFPVFAVIAGIFALAAAIVWLVKNWDTVKAKTIEVGKAIGDWFVDMGKQAYDWGANIIKTLGDGIVSAKDWLVGKVEGVFKGVRNLMPFSDAKQGPFSELTLSGGRIMTTLADGVGMQANVLRESVNDAFTDAIPPALSGSYSQKINAAGTPAAGTTNSRTVTIGKLVEKIEISGVDKDGKALALEVLTELQTLLAGADEIIGNAGMGELL